MPRGCSGIVLLLADGWVCIPFSCFSGVMQDELVWFADGFLPEDSL